ncbi:hypothetical protein PFISCL1PPCAC_21288, partial [Pristionchus fissidentatus]
VHFIPPTVSRQEVVEFMQQVGPLTALTYPTYCDKAPLVSVMCKYSSEESARRATIVLSSCELLGGKPVYVRPADYCPVGDVISASGNGLDVDDDKTVAKWLLSERPM